MKDHRAQSTEGFQDNVLGLHPNLTVQAKNQKLKIPMTYRYDTDMKRRRLGFDSCGVQGFLYLTHDILATATSSPVRIDKLTVLYEVSYGLTLWHYLHKVPESR